MVFHRASSALKRKGLATVRLATAAHRHDTSSISAFLSAAVKANNVPLTCAAPARIHRRVRQNWGRNSEPC